MAPVEHRVGALVKIGVLMVVELIGVPFDGWGRAGAQSQASRALRDAGLEAAFDAGAVLCPEPQLPPPTAARASGSGLMNEAALLAMVDAVHSRVGAAFAAGRFPLVYGGDCTVLLGAVPALRDAVSEAGLVFVDGHEDTTSLDTSPDGEAANMEVGLLLGLTGQLAPERLRRRLPALRSEATAMLGMRDDALRRQLNVASLAEHGVLLRTAHDVAADPAASGGAAAGHVLAHSAGWWLHLDVDVLARTELASQRVPGDEDSEGGLTWPELTAVLGAALAAGGCRGWSIAIYDPEQDPDGGDARRIVQLVRDVAALLPRATSDARGS
jgi:arginase